MRADEDNDSDALPRHGGGCPYYRPMSILESRRSRPDESRHLNTGKRLTVLARQTQISCVYFLVINQRNVLVNSTVTLTLTESVEFF